MSKRMTMERGYVSSQRVCMLGWGVILFVEAGSHGLSEAMTSVWSLYLAEMSAMSPVSDVLPQGSARSMSTE
jgi:hypothetical protein